MAALAFGLIGAWAAPAMGIAASTGWAIGSYLGGAIFRPTVRIEGPRLQDTKVQVSTYGTAIPIVYGAMRVAGNVIDMSAIREHSTTKKQRGKGGGTKYTTYTYETDVAVALCEGTIAGVRKIWANGELIYSIAEDATIETIIASNRMASSFTVYTGSETQMPDATLEALHGAGNVPACRGLAYVVFNTLWLEKYGNRLPNFEFEVVAKGATSAPEVTRAKVLRGNWESGGFNAGHTNWGGLQNGKTLCLVGKDLTTMGVYRLSGTDLGVVGAFTYNSGLNQMSIVETDTTCYISWAGYSDTAWRITDVSEGVTGGIATSARVMPNLSASISNNSGLCRRGDIIYAIDDTGTKFFRFNINNSGDQHQHVAVSFGVSNKWTISESAGIVYVAHAPTGKVHQFDAGTLAPVGALIDMPPNRNPNYYQFLMRDGSDGTVYLLMDNTATGKRELHQLRGGAFIPVWIDGGKSEDIQFGVTALSGTIETFGISGGSLIRCAPQNALPPPNHPSYESGIFIGQIDARLSKAAAPLGGIVQDLCGRVGLTAIDKTALDSTQVAGYVMGRQAAVRGAIEPLQSAYFFDAVESGGVLKFVKRGSAPVASIPLDDLCAGIDQADSGDPLAVVRAQEVDLPQQVTISYANIDAAYQTSAEIAQRIVTPSVNKVGAELPIAMTATQAARIADAWMYQAYAGRTTMKFKVSRKYAAIEPTDIVTVTDGVQTFTARITSKMDEGGVYALEAENENGIQYNSNAQGAGNVPPVTQISLIADSMAELIDTAILRDQDDDAGFYAALAPRATTGRWGGAVLLTGSLSDPTSELGGVTRMGVIGSILSALPAINLSGAVDAVQAPNFFDESIYIDVQLNRGELESVSVADIYQGENAAVIGNEIIQFRDAQLIGDRLYRLTGILRGRRGTEDLAAVSKPAGTRFVLLSGEDGILRPDLGTLGIGVQGGYRAVTIGGIVQQADIQTFTNNARGLKPYAPRRAYGWKTSTGVSYRWTRRSRIDGGWRNSVNVPIGEAVEEYAVYMRATGGALIATFSSAVQSLTLTTAQITAAFNAYDLANGGTISRTWIELSVAQVSATVGAGLESPVIRITL